MHKDVGGLEEGSPLGDLLNLRGLSTEDGSLQFSEPLKHHSQLGAGRNMAASLFHVRDLLTGGRRYIQSQSHDQM